MKKGIYKLIVKPKNGNSIHVTLHENRSSNYKCNLLSVIDSYTTEFRDPCDLALGLVEDGYISKELLPIERIFIQYNYNGGERYKRVCYSKYSGLFDCRIDSNERIFNDDDFKEFLHEITIMLRDESFRNLLVDTVPFAADVINYIRNNNRSSEYVEYFFNVILTYSRYRALYCTYIDFSEKLYDPNNLVTVESSDSDLMVDADKMDELLGIYELDNNYGSIDEMVTDNAMNPIDGMGPRHKK